jgi:SAM-dependent methyltransferase
MRLLELKRARLEQGHCWIVSLPAGLAIGDSAGMMSSGLRIFENEVELGPAHSAHAQIRELGRGTFSHWGTDLYFSTSDNTDPRRNGRTYSIIAPTIDEAARPLRASANVPVNYGLLEATPQQAREAAKYAVRIAKSYVEALPGGLNGLGGKSVLELGPGTSFATALILRCWGAGAVAVSDRFLSPFRPSYHVPIYRTVLELLREQNPACHVAPIEHCIAAETHATSAITAVHASLEMFEKDATQKFDIVLSNAVFEHLFSPLRAFRGLWNITADGGVGLHQVDFRDHRNFDRPLEYLLLDEFTFVEMLQEVHGECGNRLRPHQMEAMFKKVGFSTVRFRPNLWATEEYLTDLVPRLRRTPESPYQGIGAERLREISGQYELRK